jgi:HAD superfamily hydrolase (TIGR01549 family)
MARIAAVFFDIGETLVHRPVVGPGRRLAAELGLGRDEARTITRMLFREAFVSPRALAARLRATFGDIERIEETVTNIWRAQESEPVELDGATACVAAARAAGARIGIISNIWAPYEHGFRRACPAIVPLVDSWHLSYRSGTAKPDRALFDQALRALDVAPGAAVMVGDSLDKDVRPAVELGMRAVWIPHDADENGDAASLGEAPSAALPSEAFTARDLHEARVTLTALLGSDGGIGIDRRP